MTVKVIQGVKYFQPLPGFHPYNLVKAKGLTVRGDLHLPNQNVQVYDFLAEGHGGKGVFYRFTEGEGTLQLDVVTKDSKGCNKLIDNILNATDSPENISDLFAGTLKKLLNL